MTDQAAPTQPQPDWVRVTVLRDRAAEAVRKLVGELKPGDKRLRAMWDTAQVVLDAVDLGFGPSWPRSADPRAAGPGAGAPHVPMRGSDVELWLKQYRDQWTPVHREWHAVDGLLDDYRLRADTGSAMGALVSGPDGADA